jgi:transcriptional regulator with XRE-family HTH domain
MGYKQVIRSLKRAKQRRETAKVLRARGWTLQRIGDRLGISKQRVAQMINRP